LPPTPKIFEFGIATVETTRSPAAIKLEIDTLIAKTVVVAVVAIEISKNEEVERLDCPIAVLVVVDVIVKNCAWTSVPPSLRHQLTSSE